VKRGFSSRRGHKKGKRQGKLFSGTFFQKQCLEDPMKYL